MRVKMMTPGKHNGKWFSVGAALTLGDDEARVLISRSLAIEGAEGADDEREALLAKAEALGLKVAKNISMPKLIAAIEEAEGAGE